jgi:HD-GYP domain-containing protein (c-di-GMP phosphodiesterase class II)
MPAKHYLEDLLKSVESSPTFVIIDSMYARNDDSPVATAKTSEERYLELLLNYDELMLKNLPREGVESARDLPFTSLFTTSEMMLYTLLRDESMLVQVMNPVYRGKFLPSHSVNVAFLCARVGMSMGLKFKALTELCVAALLHDIGMILVHPDLYEHDRVLSDEERQQVSEHPRLGHQLLSKIEAEFPWLLRVVLEEHRRASETTGLPGEEDGMHTYSKIVSVCDAFEALTHARSFRKAYHPGDAIKNVLEGKVSRYDKKVLRAMIESLSLFPVGSMVQLNSHSIAEVIQAVEGSPLRPIIRIVESQRDEEDEVKAVINLSTEKSLHITGLVYDDRYFVPEQAKDL